MIVDLLAAWGAINPVLPVLGWAWSLRRDTRATTRRHWHDET
jgi:hypothetical protein